MTPVHDGQVHSLVSLEDGLARYARLAHSQVWELKKPFHTTERIDLFVTRLRLSFEEAPRKGSLVISVFQPLGNLWEYNIPFNGVFQD